MHGHANAADPGGGTTHKPSHESSQGTGLDETQHSELDGAQPEHALANTICTCKKKSLPNAKTNTPCWENEAPQNYLGIYV
jgi:hypothetical protein